MQLTGWKKRMIERATGITEINKRDEYQVQEITKELAVSGIGLWYLSMIAMFIMLIIDIANNTFSVHPFVLLFINMIYAGYTMLSINVNNLMDMECATEEEYIQKKRMLRKSAVKSGTFVALGVILLSGFIFPYLESNEPSLSLLDILLDIGSGVLFALTEYGIRSLNLKKLY
jgi:hypothetical protein